MQHRHIRKYLRTSFLKIFMASPHASTFVPSINGRPENYHHNTLHHNDAPNNLPTVGASSFHHNYLHREIKSPTGPWESRNLESSSYSLLTFQKIRCSISAWQPWLEHTMIQPSSSTPPCRQKFITSSKILYVEPAQKSNAYYHLMTNRESQW